MALNPLASLGAVAAVVGGALGFNATQVPDTEALRGIASHAQAALDDERVLEVMRNVTHANQAELDKYRKLAEDEIKTYMDDENKLKQDAQTALTIAKDIIADEDATKLLKEELKLTDKQVADLKDLANDKIQVAKDSTVLK